MKNRQLILSLFIVCIVIGVLVLKNLKAQHARYTVGILQTATFSPLDKTREGFVSELKKKLPRDVDFILLNAEGSISQAQANATSLVANIHCDAFFAIGTPAVEALKRVEKNRPILFAAITNPRALQLGTNITGVTDMLDVKEQIATMVKIIPHLKKVALLYNPGEPNSVYLVQKMKQEMEPYSLQVHEVGAYSAQDVGYATEQAVSQSDAILIPTDNTLAASLSYVKNIANKSNVPVIISWTGEKQSPLMQYGVNYELSGKQAADIAFDILTKHKNPQEIPYQAPKSQVKINQLLLEKMRANHASQQQSSKIKLSEKG